LTARDPDRLLPIGRVGRPHGLDGSFVVEEASEDPRRWSVGARVLVDGEPAEIVSTRRAGKGRPAIRLDRQATRGAQLAIRAADLPPADDGAWYAFELVGLAVVEEGGRTLGSVVGLYPGVANDNLELDDGTLLPLIDDAVLDVDLAGGRIVVRAGFLASSQ
jgi:16S rRNA processing protein RimM